MNKDKTRFWEEENKKDIKVDNTMKKILTLLSAFAIATSSSVTLASCHNIGEGIGGEPGKGKPKPPEEIIVEFKELKQTDKSWDYTYKSIDEYDKASKYYLNEATIFYKEFMVPIIKNQPGGFKKPLTEKEIWNNFGDFYFLAGIWYANESKWDLIRIDEFKGNYQYDQINIDSLTQNSYSKEWFIARNEKLENFKSYFLGTASDVINDGINNDGKWGVFSGGMNKALDKYVIAKTEQIKNPVVPGSEEKLKKDLEFINNLKEFWKSRFNIINKLNEKIKEILKNWKEKK